jgi:hypothetical protein
MDLKLFNNCCTEKIANTVFVPLMFLLFTFVAYIQWLLLNYLEWCDESETVVAAKMITSGRALYSEIFNNHGPLTFFFGVIIETVGNFSVPEHRIPVALMQLLILFFLLRIPLVESKFAKAVSTLIASLAFVFIFPGFLGHTAQYDIFAGILLAMAAIHYIIPAFVDREKLSGRSIALGNFLIGCTGFMALTYWPSLLLIFLLSLRRNYVHTAFKWLGISIAANLTFLMIIGSIKGYIAEHLYFNLAVLSSYMGMDLTAVLKSIIVSFSNQQILAFGLIVSAGILMFYEKSLFPWRTFFLVTAILLFFMRGPSFHAMSGIYLLTVLFSVAVSVIIDNLKKQHVVFIFAFSVSLIFIFTHVNRHVTLLKSRTFPRQSPFSQLVKRITAKEDRIIAYSFRNVEYLLADRLPASGNFFLLPSQVNYNQNPILGIAIDECKDISDYKPKAMFIDKLKRHNISWETYGSCVQKIIDADYSQVVDGKPYYIRNDLLDDLGITLSNDGSAAIQKSDAKGLSNTIINF